MRTNIKIKAILTLAFFFTIAGLLSASSQNRNFGSDRYAYGSHDGLVVNNYYNYGYDFHYAARLKRFHGSYVSVGYYGPLFTDYYWYTYQPAYIGYNIYWDYMWPDYGWGIYVNFPVYYGYYRPYYYSVFYPTFRYGYRYGYYPTYYYGGYHHHHYHYVSYASYRYPLRYRDYVPGLGYYSSRYPYYRTSTRFDRTHVAANQNHNRNRYDANSIQSSRNRTRYIRTSSGNNDRVHINNITVNNNNRGSGNRVHTNNGNGNRSGDRVHINNITVNNNNDRGSGNNGNRGNSGNNGRNKVRNNGNNTKPKSTITTTQTGSRRIPAVVNRTSTNTRTTTGRPAQFSHRSENDTRFGTSQKRTRTSQVGITTPKRSTSAVRSQATRSGSRGMVSTSKSTRKSVSTPSRSSVSRSSGTTSRKSTAVRSSGPKSSQSKATSSRSRRR